MGEVTEQLKSDQPVWVGLNAAAVKVEDISRFLSNQFTDLLAGDIKQISFTSHAGLCMAAVITGVAKTRLTSSGVLFDPMLIHQRTHKAATKVLLLDLH